MYLIISASIRKSISSCSEQISGNVCGEGKKGEKPAEETKIFKKSIKKQVKTQYDYEVATIRVSLSSSTPLYTGSYMTQIVGKKQETNDLCEEYSHVCIFLHAMLL